MSSLEDSMDLLSFPGGSRLRGTPLIWRKKFSRPPGRADLCSPVQRGAPLGTPRPSCAGLGHPVTIGRASLCRPVQSAKILADGRNLGRGGKCWPGQRLGARAQRRTARILATPWRRLRQMLWHGAPTAPDRGLARRLQVRSAPSCLPERPRPPGRAARRRPTARRLAAAAELCDNRN